MTLAPSSAPVGAPAASPMISGSALSIASVALSILGTAVALMAFVGLLCYLRRPSTHPRAPMGATYLGLALISGGCLVAPFTPMTPFMCYLRLWTVQCGISVLLLAQCYLAIRIWYLYVYHQAGGAPSLDQMRRSSRDVSQTLRWRSHEEVLLLVGSILAASHVAILCCWVRCSPPPR